MSSIPDPINTAYVMNTGSNTAVRLFWKKSTASPSPAVNSSGYIVKISTNSGAVYTTRTPNTVINPNGGDLCYSDITGLSSSTTYMFKVLAKNSNGTSDIGSTNAAINTNDITTPLRTIVPSSIPGKPLLFGSDNADGSGITLDWYPYPSGVTFRVRDVTSNDELVLPDDLTTNTLNITADVPGDAPDLIMGNTYTFSVQATLNGNDSQVASVDIVPTNVPDAPSNIPSEEYFTLEDLKYDHNPSIRVSWSAPQNNGKPILGYSLYQSTDNNTYTPVSGYTYNFEEPDVNYPLNGDATECEVNNLSYGTTYYFKLTATNENGESDQSIAEKCNSNQTTKQC